MHKYTGAYISLNSLDLSHIFPSLLQHHKEKQEAQSTVGIQGENLKLDNGISCNSLDSL